MCLNALLNTIFSISSTLFILFLFFKLDKFEISAEVEGEIVWSRFAILEQIALAKFYFFSFLDLINWDKKCSFGYDKIQINYLVKYFIKHLPFWETSFDSSY